MQQNKTTLVQLPFTTLGQETRLAYFTTPPNPHLTVKRIMKGGSQITTEIAIRPKIAPSDPSVSRT